MTTGLGLTSALAARHDVNHKNFEEFPIKVTDSVVFIKKDIEGYPFFTKYLEVKSNHELLKELDENKKQEDERKLAEFKKKQQELKRQRIADNEQQREIDEKRSQQHTLIKAREKLELKEEATSVKDTLNVEFSYYVAMCDSGCIGKTATGIDVRNTVYYQGMRIVATDPNVIPTWSIIQFELHGQKVRAIALDTGGYIKGHKIDMLVDSVSEANKLGRHVKKVEILQYGK